MGFLWNELIMKPMVNILTIFYSLFSDNFGLSIIFFTILIRILMIPISFRQVKQMLGMQSIQPKLKKIQEKYKDKKDRDSRQKMSQETMALYKQSGCKSCRVFRANDHTIANMDWII